MQKLPYTQKDLVSMLYYLGYLTIVGEDFWMTELKVPNKVMKEAKKQIEEYVSCEDIKQIEGLYKYTVVAINDNVYVERVN